MKWLRVTTRSTNIKLLHLLHARFGHLTSGSGSGVGTLEPPKVSARRFVRSYYIKKTFRSCPPAILKDRSVVSNKQTGVRPERVGAEQAVAHFNRKRPPPVESLPLISNPRSIVIRVPTRSVSTHRSASRTISFSFVFLFKTFKNFPGAWRS